MHEDIFTRDTSGNSNRELSLPRAIDEEVMFLSPGSEGFAEESFPCVSNARRFRIIVLERG
jgi:hypothetical protein